MKVRLPAGMNATQERPRAAFPFSQNAGLLTYWIGVVKCLVCPSGEVTS